MSSKGSQIIDMLDAIGPSSFTDDTERRHACAAIHRLLSKLELPFERAFALGFERPFLYAALQTTVDLGLWTAWNAAGGNEKTIDELVKLCKTSVAPNLLRRHFRLLAASHVVEETDEDTFKPTTFSRAIGDESTNVRALIEVGNYQYMLPGQNLPRYLAKIGYVEPTAIDVNNFSDIDPDGLNFFGRLQKTPKYFEDFTAQMAGWTLLKTPWTKLYDPAKLLDGADLSRGPLVVDLGGSSGTDLTHVLTAQPDLPAGALILQDLPEILEKFEFDAKITAQAHDFFTPQPVKGSRAYFMHAVLHDWPDDKAKELLENTRAAMVKGYSKLFVYDIVLLPKGVSKSQAAMDVGMMSLLSARERTKSQWEQLLTSAGFKVVNYWPDPREYEMLIEAEIA